MEERIIKLDPKIKLVYVWQFPVRLYHWVNVIAVVTLCITGYLIGSPLIIQGATEASFSYWYGTVRFIHFAAGYVFFFNFVFRLYWGFVGNEYSRWHNFIPHKKSQWKSVWNVMLIDIFQFKLGPYDTIGHNSLASFTYFVTFIAFVFQSFTGFGMYAAMSTSWFPKLFSWSVPLIGGDLAARNIHHIWMWVLVIFAIVHVYLVFYHDYVERNGITSSMIGGWKFVEVKEVEEVIIEKNRKNRH